MVFIKYYTYNVAKGIQGFRNYCSTRGYKLKLDEIHDNWSKDVIIEQTDLPDEALKIPRLHEKYIRIFTTENLLYQKLLKDYKVLELEKYEFYTMGPTDNSREKGWELPDKGMIIKSEVQRYLDADKDLIQFSLKLAYQKEKVDLLDSILKNIANRSFIINNAMSAIKFYAGVS